MKILTVILALLLTMVSEGQESRNIEQTLSSMANIVIPRVDFSGGTSVEEAVDFLNICLHSPDPAPPKQWKIRFEVSEASAKKKISIVGKELNLYQVLGRIADTIDAELLITRDGFTLRDVQKPALQGGAIQPTIRPESKSKKNEKTQAESKP